MLLQCNLVNLYCIQMNYTFYLNYFKTILRYIILQTIIHNIIIYSYHTSQVRNNNNFVQICTQVGII